MDNKSPFHVGSKNKCVVFLKKKGTSHRMEWIAAGPQAALEERQHVAWGGDSGRRDVA